MAIHGGAGVDPNLLPPEHRQEEAKRVLVRCLQAGVGMLHAGASAFDAMKAAVRELETDPFFNSGRDRELTHRRTVENPFFDCSGTVEMEASIMDGRGRRCGAVSGVSTVENPISLARRVMDESPHSYLGVAGDGVEDIAREQVNDDDKLPSLLALWRDQTGHFSKGPRIQPTTGHGRGWERYLGLPIEQTNDTCVLVSCIICLEAKHRLEYEKFHGEGTFFIPRTRRAHEPLRKLFDECRADGTWVENKGADVGDVLDKIQAMGRVPVEAGNAPPCCILPLCGWQSHNWYEYDYFSGTDGLSPERVAGLLDSHGPCVGLLWVDPPYDDVDAGRDGTVVYRGCGRDDNYRKQSKERYGDEAGWHAVVCFDYRFRGQQMDVLAMDNHDDATGPRRWIAVEAFEALYTLTVERLNLLPLALRRRDDDDDGSSSIRRSKRPRRPNPRFTQDYLTHW